MYFKNQHCFWLLRRIFRFRRPYSRPQSVPTYCLMHILHKTGKCLWKSQALGMPTAKSQGAYQSLENHMFLQIYTQKLYEGKRLSGPKKKYQIWNKCIQYLDWEDKESQQTTTSETSAVLLWRCMKAVETW